MLCRAHELQNTAGGFQTDRRSNDDVSFERRMMPVHAPYSLTGPQREMLVRCTGNTTGPGSLDSGETWMRDMLH